MLKFIVTKFSRACFSGGYNEVSRFVLEDLLYPLRFARPPSRGTVKLAPPLRGFTMFRTPWCR